MQRSIAHLWNKPTMPVMNCNLGRKERLLTWLALLTTLEPPGAASSAATVPLGVRSVDTAS